jgi:two-component system nitrate/nitrite response regulator NarL
MHIFVSQKPMPPVRWHQAFPDAVTVRTPAEAANVIRENAVVWLDYTVLAAADRALWLQELVKLRRPVVVLSNVPNDDEAMQVFGGGGVGYSHVLASAGQLREIALVVEHGGYWAGSGFVEKVVKLSARALGGATVPEDAGILRHLTERERMVAKQIARGATNAEIAAALGITERTVKAHLSAIFAKSGARDRVQLVLMLAEPQTTAA